MLTTRKLLSTLLGFAALCGVALSQVVSTVPTDALFEPFGVAVDSATGDYYISDGSNSRVVRYDPVTGETTALVLAVTPEGIAIADRAGLGRVLVFADTEAHTIRYYRLSDGKTDILAGADHVHGAQNNTSGLNARFFSPAGLAAGPDGSIYVADLQNNLVRRIENNAAASVTTVAASESFLRPAAVALDGSRLFVADSGHNSVKEFDLANADSLTTTIIGFDGPRGLLWVGGKTGLLVSDTANSVIRYVLGSKGSAKTVLVGELGTSGNVEGAPTVARLSEPVGLAVDNNGDILIADLKNNSLRKFTRGVAQAPIVTPGTIISTNTVNVLAKQPVPVTTPGSVFRYTTDGSDPIPTSALFPSGVSGLAVTGGPLPLKIRAYNPDFSASLIVSNNYTFGVNPIAFTPQGGKFSNDVDVVISTLTADASIRFTASVNNSAEPIVSGSVWSDRTLSSNTTLIVRGFKDGYDASGIVSNRFDFFVDPIAMSPTGGSFTNDVEITAFTVTTNAVIHYSNNGENPTESSPVWSTRHSLPAGKIQLRAFRAGYTPSPVITNDFSFTVADPVITPASASTNNSIVVKVNTGTVGALLRYVIVSEDSAVNPTEEFGLPIGNGIETVIGTNGVFKVIAYRPAGDGYVSSKVVSAKFDLKVATPTIAVSSNPSDNAVQVVFTTATSDATFYYASDPQHTNILSVAAVGKSATITLNRTGLLAVSAVRSGFINSDTASTAIILKAATPVIQLYSDAARTPASGSTNINVMYAELTTATVNPNTVVYFTLDGTSPLVSTTKQTFTSGLIRLDTNATIKAAARVNDSDLNVFEDSTIASQDVFIQADAPVMNPPRGFFQDGTSLTLTVSRTNGSAFSTTSKIYYTLDGSDPTESSPLYTGPIPLNGVSASSPDLRAVRSRAFADRVLPSLLTSGSLATNSTIGIARAAKGGVGSKIVVPVVVGLKPTDQLRSLQYRVQVWPTGTAPNLDSVTSFSSLDFGTNDFVVITGSQSDVTSTNEWFRNQTTTPIRTNEIAMSFIGTGAHLLLKDYATVNLLAVEIPKTAKPGDVYAIRILEPSGTTNASQAILKLVPAPDQTITVANIPYLVGDSSPGVWYNAGDFGDGNLDNADVNNAFYASLKIHSPFTYSDAFNAMDSFPADEDGFVGGDGQIRLLDWQVTLFRSLRIDPQNWMRSWSTDGLLDTVSSGLAPSPTSANHGRVTAAAVSDAPAVEWFRQALVEAESVNNAQAGSVARLPIYVDIKPGRTISALQFLAEVQSAHGAITTPVSFILAEGLPNGITVDGLPSNKVGHAWSLDSGLSLSGRTLIGYVEFTVPLTAVQGDCYTVRFLNVDGAPSIRVQYDLESLPGCVWVGTAGTNNFGRLSDEWRSHFFGSLSNVLSKPDQDADGDGVSNWEEFQRGSNPAKLRFQVKQALADQFKPGFKIRWLTLPGKQYIIECTTTPADPASWVKIATAVKGDGTIKEILDSNTLDKTKFYRMRAE